MLTKTKIALAATLFAATSSVVLAQGFDPNMANRYPAYGNPNASAQAVAPRGTFQSAPVRLYQGRNAAVTDGQPVNQQDWFAVETHDRAASPYAGGGF